MTTAVVSVAQQPGARMMTAELALRVLICSCPVLSRTMRLSILAVCVSS